MSKYETSEQSPGYECLKISSYNTTKCSAFAEFPYDPIQFNLLSFVRFNNHETDLVLCEGEFLTKVLKAKEF